MNLLQLARATPNCRQSDCRLLQQGSTLPPPLDRSISSPVTGGNLANA
jgi:hypothetical protein